MKTCSKCGIAKEFPGQFFRDARLKSGYRAVCKQCDVAVFRPARKSNSASKSSAYRATPEAREKRNKKELERKAYKIKMGLPLYVNPKKAEKDRQYRQSPNGRITQFKAKARRRALGGQHTISGEKWERTLKAFAGKCAYCLVQLNEKTMVRDHFIPLFAGGGTSFGNIVPACWHCNSSKQHIDPKEWCSPEVYERIQVILNLLANAQINP